MATQLELANAIRALSMDAVQKANSGHPGAPMGMADIAEVLWNDYLVHNPADPDWVNRDRFVLSNGHGSMLLYSLLYLTGYKSISIDDIKNFRQLNSICAGHPEYKRGTGIETTTGPLGQGLGNAVGMAVAEEILRKKFGQTLINNRSTVLTHCNAGALATAGFGTALGVIRAAVNAGKKIDVIADETRPFLQGARLTVWELMEDNIPVKLITDNMSGFFMKNNQVDAVVVGADRIAGNGDVANKIGTYMVAVLAQKHQIPFYVAAPISTLDLSLNSGEEIPIEQRSEGEVVSLNNKRITPEGASAAHPAFDITPNDLVTAIITDKGIAKPPYITSLKNLSMQ